MDDYLDRLEGMLQEELQLYDRWLALEEKKQGALINSQSHLINDLVKEEQELLRYLREADHARKFLLQRLCEKNQIENPGWLKEALSKLINNARSEEFAARCQNMMVSRNLMVQKLKKIGIQVRRNEALVSQSLDLIKRFYRALVGDTQDAPQTYTRRGQAGLAGAQSLINHPA